MACGFPPRSNSTPIFGTQGRRRINAPPVSPQTPPILCRQDSALLEDSTWRSALQMHRTTLRPALPHALTNLDESFPRFEEATDCQGSSLFPRFASAVPLMLRKADRADVPSPSPDSSAYSESLDLGMAVSSTASTSCIPENTNARMTRAPMRVGIVFCCESNSPVHPVNVTAGLWSYLEKAAPDSQVIGFEGGPNGFLAGRGRELSLSKVLSHLNASSASWCNLGYGTCNEGSFAPSDRREEASKAMVVCSKERLDGLLVIGGGRDLAWAAALSVCFAEADNSTVIVGVPHGKNLQMYVPRYIPITLGFDSARRSICDTIGNVIVDSLSSKKYWHFVSCADNALTMELTLQTRANFSVFAGCLRENPAVGNDVQHMPLADTVARLAEGIEKRRANGRLSGVVLNSSHLINRLPEMNMLKEDLLDLLRSYPPEKKFAPFEVVKLLRRESSKDLFKRLPRNAQFSLLTKRDHNGIPLLPSDLDSHRILGRFVQQAVASSLKHPFDSFAPRFHSVSLLGNTPLPSPFDCALGFSLGHTAAALLLGKRHFYVAACADTHLPVKDWKPCAVPFSFLYRAQEGFALAQPQDAEEALKLGGPKHAIPKLGCFLKKKLAEVYDFFKASWNDRNAFRAVGPLQFDSDGDVGPMCDRSLNLLAEYLSVDELKAIVQPVTNLPPPLKMSSHPLIFRDVRVSANLSALEQRRLSYEPLLPSYLTADVRVQAEDITPQSCEMYLDLARAFPFTHPQTNRAVRLTTADASSRETLRDTSGQLRIGIVFASHQAPGYHTAVLGIHEYLAQLYPPPEIIGFVGGYSGLIKNSFIIIDKDMVQSYRNLGGNDMLCHFGDPVTLACRDNLEAVVHTIEHQKLDGLIFMGNLESTVDFALVSEACAARNCATRILGIPISIDCNIPFVQQTVGYDTATRTVTSLVGSVGSLAESVGKMWIFVRVGGDSGSHVAVQVALAAHPCLVLVAGGTIGERRMSSIVSHICDLIVARHAEGIDHGVVVLPLGYVTEIVEMRLLIEEIYEIVSNGECDYSWEAIPNIAAKLKPTSAALFDVIPRDVQHEICFGSRSRRCAAHVDRSSIESDRLLLRFVEIELQRRESLGLIDKGFFEGFCHPMVYHSRSGLPTDFDCDLAYTLGWSAALLLMHGHSGKVVHAANLDRPIEEWQVRAVPLTSLVQVQMDSETDEYRVFPARVRMAMQKNTIVPLREMPPPETRLVRYSGPIQFDGPTTLDPEIRKTWYMRNQPLHDPTNLLVDLSEICSSFDSMMAQAKTESTLYVVNSLLTNAVSTLKSFKSLSDACKLKMLSDVEICNEQIPLMWRIRVTTQGFVEVGDDPQGVNSCPITPNWSPLISACRTPPVKRLDRTFSLS